MTEHRSAFEGQAPRILVVDDTPDNLFLMNGLLEDRYQVIQAASGQDALKIIMSKQPPDMVLLDIMMPDMDGYEVLRRIRQHPPTANIPVIFLTALAAPKDQRLGLNLGAVDYLTKPIDPELVVQRIEAHVKATARARRMDALSERLSGHLPPEEWQAIFHGPGLEDIHFEQKPLTVLFVECAELAGWSDRDRGSFLTQVDGLAARMGGLVDPYAWGGTAIFFEDPSDCVRMAMELQRGLSDMFLRMGVTTALCDVGSFRSQGRTHSTLIGPATGLAAKVAASAARGSIVISPEAYALVQAEVHSGLPGCLLTEEFQDSDVATAQLTLTPPRVGPAVSTFSGLRF